MGFPPKQVNQDAAANAELEYEQGVDDSPIGSEVVVETEGRASSPIGSLLVGDAERARGIGEGEVGSRKNNYIAERSWHGA